MKVQDYLKHLAGGMTREAFLRAHPHPFLVEIEEAAGQKAGGIEITARLPSAAVRAQSLASREARAIVLSPEALPLLVGRAPKCGLILEHGSVSKEHARVVRRADGKIGIEDLGSTNGTWVSTRKVEKDAPDTLLPDETVRFGRATVFQLLEPTGFCNYLELLLRFGM